LSGPLVLGDLVVFYQAFNQGQQMLRALLGNTQQIFTNLLFLGKLYEFLALEARVVSPAQPVPLPALRQGIRFEHVSFRYPGSARLALEDFNLEIPAGRITAILGPNGSGKSTVIKLLCRLYDPEAGRIAIDGVDLRAVSLEELRRAISPLFQVPIHYGATARENIALGDLAAAPSQARVEAAARTAGAHDVITRLPGGYDCMLGKIFANGTELSVGEWQRIALARAFLRPAPLLLLDEPTSAMDAWAETDWMERLRQSAKGRTTVVITHRLSTAVRADVIFVMERGRVVESGSHAELLAAGRRYAAAWTAQMRDGASEAATR
jgi:ATP-binding cassette subfamily B protein